MIIFHTIEFLWLLLIILILFIAVRHKKSTLNKLFSARVLEKIQLKDSGISHKLRLNVLILAMIFIIIAIARPQINNGEIKLKKSWSDIIFALDISKSMFAEDIYPNRLEFAKHKLITNLDSFTESRIALLGFSQQTFLISPLTQDFYSLKFLIQNISLDSSSLKGTNFLNTLIAINDLFKDSKKKSVLFLTDGGDNTDFSEEIAYAKNNNITVYVYNIATEQGGVIKDKNGVLRDKNNNIVVVRVNTGIKQLAQQTGGAYLAYSLTQNDLELLVNDIKNKFDKVEKKSSIKNRQELFYYPLMLAIIFLIIALFSLPRYKR